MKLRHCLLFLSLLAPLSAQTLRTVQTRTANGIVEGVVSADNQVRTFKGIPFAAPPVGRLRWRAPQPAANWTGIRKAVDYGPRCMQGRIYNDMIFHDEGPSEDCLYLNIWMPEAAIAGKRPEQVRLPVMVWIYGGGFQAGGSSEPRQDGGNLSRKGVIVVSMNYRLGIFGFFSHPELTKESDHNASGNYGLLDQLAAVQWVHDNIARFGGDPDNVTIFGESAGSFSVSALMASPLAKGLFRRAIGESGAYFSSTLPARPRAEAEESDVKFAESSLGSSSLEKLRALPADQILQSALKAQGIRFSPNIDGYFLPASVPEIFAAGKQSQVALLAGWNADEGSWRTFFGKDEPNAQNFAAQARRRFGDKADRFLKVYPAETDEQAKRSAQDFAGDQFIGFGTWRWLEAQTRTGKSPVYRYEFDQAVPLPNPAAHHASEIEFVFQVLSARDLPWRPEDRKVSELMGDYWTNFAKTGDPNGPGLPKWPIYSAQNEYSVMHFMADSKARPDDRRGRYELLETIFPLEPR
jgi:para-nitrobenzyl esterase